MNLEKFVTLREEHVNHHSSFNSKKLIGAHYIEGPVPYSLFRATLLVALKYMTQKCLTNPSYLGKINLLGYNVSPMPSFTVL